MMIHADEASKISQANRNINAKDVEDLNVMIRIAANKGKSELVVYNKYGARVDSLIKILRENGYSVARETKRHQLDPEELIITW